MASWPNFKLFRPKLSPNWTKNGQFYCFINWILIDAFIRFQILHTFFEIFEIYVHFWIMSKLSSEFKFPNFFPNFFAKISHVLKFRFFLKNFRTLTAKLFRNLQKQKVRKIPSNAGPQFTKIIWNDLHKIMSCEKKIPKNWNVIRDIY